MAWRGVEWRGVARRMSSPVACLVNTPYVLRTHRYRNRKRNRDRRWGLDKGRSLPDDPEVTKCIKRNIIYLNKAKEFGT